MTLRFAFADIAQSILATTRTPPLVPSAGLDECVHEDAVASTLFRLCEAGILQDINPLHLQRRVREDGSLINLAGSASLARRGGIDVGRQVRGYSWDDQNVVSWLLAYLDRYGRMVVLTENTKRDAFGLRTLLSSHVAPVLAQPSNMDVSLLVAFKTARITYPVYCERLAALLASWEWAPGYHEMVFDNDVKGAT